MTKWFKVGKIVNTHGIRGEIRVISVTDFKEERYAIGSKLYIEHPDNPTEKVEVIVSSHRKHKNFDLLCFEGYTTLEAVEKFKGGVLQVSEEALTPLKEGEYYYYEIIGCRVLTDEGEELGRVKEILAPGANDVWVVEKKAGDGELLIPYIDDVVKSIDVNKKIITVQLLEGLIE